MHNNLSISSSSPYPINPLCYHRLLPMSLDQQQGQKQYYESQFKLCVWDRLASMLVHIKWQDIKQTETIPFFYPFQHLLFSTVPLIYLASCCLSQDLNFVIFWRLPPFSQI